MRCTMLVHSTAPHDSIQETERFAAYVMALGCELEVGGQPYLEHQDIICLT